MGGALYQKVSEKLPGADMKETAKNFFLYGACLLYTSRCV